MKLVAVGDIHGRDCWKTLDPAKYDKIVFIGDYADSVRISPDIILANLREIIELKKRFPAKVCLLLGNHDIQYSEYPRYRCSGFNEVFKFEYIDLYRAHRDLFQVAFQAGTHLFTHAGVSHDFAKLNLKEHYDAIVSRKINVGDLLNDIHHSKNQAILHSIGVLRKGHDPFGGITWADYRETSGHFLPGYHQVVGHTPKKEIVTEGDAISSFTYIDVLETVIAFYELELDDKDQDIYKTDSLF